MIEKQLRSLITRNEKIDLSQYEKVNIYGKETNIINFSPSIQYENRGEERELIYSPIPLSEFNQKVADEGCHGFEFSESYFVKGITKKRAKKISKILQTKIIESDHHLIARDKLAICGNKTGYGLYAATTIPPNAVIPYCGVLSNDEEKLINSLVNCYICSFDENKVTLAFEQTNKRIKERDGYTFTFIRQCNARQRGSIARFINWSISSECEEDFALENWTADPDFALDKQDVAFANVKFTYMHVAAEEEKKVFLFPFYITTSEIKPGDQILCTHNYMKYWNFSYEIFHTGPRLFSKKTGDIISQIRPPSIVNYRAITDKESSYSNRLIPENTLKSLINTRKYFVRLDETPRLAEISYLLKMAPESRLSLYNYSRYCHDSILHSWIPDFKQWVSLYKLRPAKHTLQITGYDGKKTRFNLGFGAHFEKFHGDEVIEALNTLAIELYQQHDYESAVAIWSFLLAHLRFSNLQCPLFHDNWDEAASDKQFIHFAWNVTISYCNYKQEKYAAVIFYHLEQICCHIPLSFKNNRENLINEFLLLFKPESFELDQRCASLKIWFGSNESYALIEHFYVHSDMFSKLTNLSFNIFISLCCYVFSVVFHDVPQLKDYELVYSDASDASTTSDTNTPEKQDTYYLVSCATGISSCLFSSADRKEKGNLSTLNQHAVQAYKSSAYLLAITIGSFLLIQERLTEKYLIKDNKSHPAVSISRKNQALLAWNLGNAYKKTNNQEIAVYLLIKSVELDPDRKSTVQKRLQEWGESFPISEFFKKEEIKVVETQKSVINVPSLSI